jgi:hypothetical protein
MRLLAFLLFVTAVCCNVQVLIDDKGGFNVTVGNQLWLRSARTAVYADDRWYSSDDKTLALVKISDANGVDPLLGSWNETQLIYSLVRNQSTSTVVARIRQWSIVFAFTFHLDMGENALTNTISLDMEEVRTVFPSFTIEQFNANDQRGYFTYGGSSSELFVMLLPSLCLCLSGSMTGDEDKHAGRWNSSSTVIRSGMQGGPVILFDLNQQGEQDVLIISPFSHFMATSLSQKNNVLEYGVIGSMSSVPASYSHAMILYYSPRGINEAMREWGLTMRQAFNRTDENRRNDLTVNYLGYYTDNGGYYYYNTAQGMNYETTMVNVARQVPLPFHYIQLDSWWYYKGINDGVSQWTARPDVFPDGLSILHRRLENIPLAAHNRYWAYDTVYKKKYAFALDVGNGKALPIGNDSFWLDLLTEARGWGLVLYEQDWLNKQTIDFRPTRTDIFLGEQWLTSMGAAAETVGMNIQYCMCLPRHILQSLQIPRVTHARVSDDYATHLKDRKKSTWNIGITSLLADAVGLAPFKDVLWSTSEQPGSPYQSSAMEIFPDREILIATLSTGPVGPGDAIQYTNVSRIMRCCRQDGLILKPDRPLTAINVLLSDWASADSQMPGELYSTQTDM